MAIRYRARNYSQDGTKMERNVQVSICGTASWKAMVLEESQKRQISISQLVRQAVEEKCGRGIAG